MKRFMGLLLGTLFFLTSLSACGEAVPPAKEVKRRNQATAQRSEDVGKKAAQRYTLKTNWVKPSETAQETQLAKNQLTKNFVLVFDGSGSMQERKCSGKRMKIEVAKEAVAEWVQTVPEDANLGLVAFHKNTWSTLRLGVQNREKFIRTIEQIAPDGGTPLSSAVEHAYNMLRDQARLQLGYGEYTVVVVTDGKANSPAALARRVTAILDDSPVIIHTIGFCIDQNHSLNQPGRTMYKTANNPEALRKGLQEVLAEAESFDVSEFGR